MKHPGYIANFDSGSAMMRAVAHFLHGKDFPGLGIQPRYMKPFIVPVNWLPVPLRDGFYSWMGWMEAIRPSGLSQVRAEGLSRWVVSEYPRRQYPAAMIGSANGAAVHLCTALGIPLLPQTFLIPVRRFLHADEPKQDLDWGRRHAAPLLQANPELQLHHMNDANQDRLMIKRMTYFRVKRRRLGAAYEEFLERNVEPGGTLFLLECGLQWPTVRIGDRHVFQHGALGGATADEFRYGSLRVEAYLKQYGSHVRRWDAPEPNEVSPEAEWGFEPSFRDDVERFARRRGYRVRRILFKEPEHLSPLVADLYRWWYHERRLSPNRLVASSFIVLEPWWTLRTGSVPYWMTFNKEPSANLLDLYLEGVPQYDEIYMMLFSHGVESVGLTPIDRWKRIMGRARRRSGFIGVDEQHYPRDFATFIRYNIEFPKQVTARYPMPGPLALSQLDRFLAEHGDRYGVQWRDLSMAGEDRMAPPVTRTPLDGPQALHEARERRSA